jgi:O-antigen ligase
MASDAITLWSRDRSTILRGVGVGGFGESLARANPGYARGNVVNNQFIEILTELGVIGLGIFIASLVCPIYTAYQRRYWVGSIMIVALVIQWNFFSGNPNALHIWTVLALTYAYATSRSRTALG